MSFYFLKIRFTGSIVLIQVGKKGLEVLQKKLKDCKPISENRENIRIVLELLN